MPSAPFYSNVFLQRGPSSLLLKKTKKITFWIINVATWLPLKGRLNFRTRQLFQQRMIQVSSDSIKTKTFFESFFNIYLSTIKQITILLLCNVIQIISYIAYCLNFFEWKNISKKKKLWDCRLTRYRSNFPSVEQFDWTLCSLGTIQYFCSVHTELSNRNIFKQSKY